MLRYSKFGRITTRRGESNSSSSDIVIVQTDYPRYTKYQTAESLSIQPDNKQDVIFKILRN